MMRIKRVISLLLVLVLMNSVAFASEMEKLGMKNQYRKIDKFGIAEEDKVSSDSNLANDAIGEMKVGAGEITAISGEEYDTYIIKSGYSAQFSYESVKDMTKKAAVGRWVLDDEGTSRIGDYDWKKRIGKGGILVQKSYDREKWETVFTNTDVFKEYSRTIKNFYSASRADLQQGCYYRVVMAYKKSMKLKDSSIIFGLVDTSEYKRVCCVEVYEVYLVSSEDTEGVSVTIEGSTENNTGAMAAEFGSAAVSNASIANQVAGQEQFVTNTNAGHAFAAEAANIQNATIDAIGSEDNVIHTGANNAPNGPDYIIEQGNGTVIQIQTKYYNSPSATLRACFDENGSFRYMTEAGKPMQIEVPKDQYDKVVALMREKIINNQIPGVTDPAEAENIIRKGSVTYKQAVNIAKAGNIDSLLYDAKNGVVTSTVSMGISAVIQFAACIWNHDDVETALKTSLYTGLRTLGNTFVISVLASQLGRTGLQTLLIPGSQAIVKAIGPKASAVIINAARIGLKPIYGAAAMKSAAKLLRSNVVTAIASFVVFSIPDVVDLVKGRISVKQLLKNSAVAIGGIGGTFAGMAAGAAIGSVFPGAGNVIGGIVGSVAGGLGVSIGVKALTDLIAEDDAQEMLKIISMEFQNIAEEYLLNQTEAEEAVDLLQKKLDANELKNMFASGNHHKYAREMIEPIVDEVIAKREEVVLPPEETIQKELVETLEEIYEELDPELQKIAE